MPRSLMEMRMISLQRAAFKDACSRTVYSASILNTFDCRNSSQISTSASLNSGQFEVTWWRQMGSGVIDVPLLHLLVTSLTPKQLNVITPALLLN